MNTQITYRKIRYGEEENACHLIMDCFGEFIAPGYSEEGITEFLKYVNPEFTRYRLANNNCMILAFDNNELVGVIEVRNYNHISLFFVRKEYQNKGIGKELNKLAINECKIFRPDIAVIEVHSSPYAVPIYEKLGFVQVSAEQVENGMRFTPMKYEIG
jgi:GNAT superfamily N-acetyltransferase